MKTTIVLYLVSLCAGCIPIVAGIVEAGKPDTGQPVCKTKEGYTSCNPKMGGFVWYDPSDESRHSCETTGAHRGDRCMAGVDEGVVR